METQKANEDSIPHSNNFNNTNFRESFYNNGRHEQQVQQEQPQQPQQSQSSIDAENLYKTTLQRSSSKSSLTENTTTTSYASPAETYYNMMRPDRSREHNF